MTRPRRARRPRTAADPVVAPHVVRTACRDRPPAGPPCSATTSPAPPAPALARGVGATNWPSIGELDVMEDVNATTATTGGGGGGSAYSPIQATGASATNGATAEPSADLGGGTDLGSLANGAWAQYPNVDFGAGGATQFYGRVAAGGRQHRRLAELADGAGEHQQGDRHAHVFLTFTSGQPAAFGSLHRFDFGP